MVVCFILLHLASDEIFLHQIFPSYDILIYHNHSTYTLSTSLNYHITMQLFIQWNELFIITLLKEVIAAILSKKQGKKLIAKVFCRALITGGNYSKYNRKIFKSMISPYLVLVCIGICMWLNAISFRTTTFTKLHLWLDLQNCPNWHKNWNPI